MIIRTHGATPDGLSAWEAAPDFHAGAYGTADSLHG